MNEGESMAERLARQARELVDRAGTETGRLARIGRIEIDLLGIQREQGREYRNLGERAHELIRRGELPALEHDSIAALILRRLGELEAVRRRHEQEIASLRSPVDRDRG